MTTDPFDAPGKKPAPAIHPTSAPPEQPTRPTTLRFEHRRHMYFDGKAWLPGVTGIAGKIEDKGGLLAWHSNMTAECAIQEAAELSRIRRLDGDDEAYEWLRHAADRKRDAATVSGSDLHDVADRMLSGAPLPEHLHDDVKQMAERVLEFMADYAVQVCYSEARLVHRSIGYAGTTDTIGIVPQYGDRPIIVDWKTSASMYRTPKFSNGKNAMQLAAYANAEVMFWDDKTEADMLPVNTDVGLIVMIRPEGYKVYDYDLHRAWPQFRRAFDNYFWWRDADSLARPARPQAPLVVPAPVDAGPMVHNVLELEKKFGEAAASADETDPLLAQISEVLDPATFDDLWEAHQGIWTDEHTAAVKARIAELGIAS